MSTTNDCCQRLTDHVTCTGIGQCSTQSQCADKEHQHIPRNIAESGLLIDYAEQNHQQTADQRNEPSGQMQLRCKDQANNRCKEQEDTNLIHNRAELLLSFARILFLQCLNGDDRLLRSELRAKENCPERNNDKDRPCGDRKINGTDTHSSKAIGFHETSELTSHLDRGCQWKDTAASHTDDHNGEHILRTAVSGLVAQCCQQRADDRINDHGAGNEVGEQNCQKDVTKVSHFEAAMRQLHDAVTHTVHQRGTAETRCYNKHTCHQQGVHIRKAGQCTGIINTAGDVQGGH